MLKQSTKIVLLGAGYAGIMAALRVAGKTRRMATAVTLINGLDHFVERPRLHEQALGAEPDRRPIHKMLAGSRVRFLQGWVTHISPETSLVTLNTAAGTEHISYDYLILALGSHVDRESIPGIDRHAYALDPYGALAAPALKQRLETLGQSPFRAVVAGAGATASKPPPNSRRPIPIAK